LSSSDIIGYGCFVLSKTTIKMLNKMKSSTAGIKTVALLIVIFSFHLNFASDLFTYDKQKVKDAMKSITAVEQFVKENNLSYSEVSKANPELLAFANFSVQCDTMLHENKFSSGIPSFAWGCFLGPIGLLAVITDKDASANDITGAVGGCVINGACVAGTLFLMYY